MTEKGRQAIAKTAERLLDLARRKGADQAEVFLETKLSTAVFVRDQKLENLKVADVSGCALRVLKHSAFGFACTNRFDDRSLGRLVEDALSAAQHSSADEFNCLASISGTDARQDLEILDEQMASVAVTEKIERAMLIEKAARQADRRIKHSVYIVYADAMLNTGIFNTEGVSQVFGSSACQAIAWVGAVDDSAVESGLSDAAARRFSALDCAAVGRDAALRATALLGGKKIASGSLGVVLDGRVAAEFLSFLATQVFADRVQRGKSALAGKLGQKIGSSSVTIVDDGLLPGGMGTAPVDAEGVPQQQTTVIDQGRLVCFLFDCYCAKRGSARSTGNASRASYRASPAVSTTNFYLKPGQASREELVAQVSKGVLITSIRGLFAGIDVATGDFSIPAQGIYVENGAPAYPVKDFHISGNLFSMLSDVQAVGGTLHWINAGRFGSPDLLIGQLSIAGK